jgi:hypothetical protein
MGNPRNVFTLELNKDPLMSFIVNKLSIEAIYWALFLHLLVVVYVWYTGNLFELSIPPEIQVTVDVSKLQAITPIRDPIFITGIVFIVIIGYVWLKLNSDLPEALNDLKRNGIIKGRKTRDKGKEEDTIIIFRRPFKSLENFYKNKVVTPKVTKKEDKDEYEIFLKRFEFTLNNKLCYVAGFVGALLYFYVLYQYTMKAPIEESMTLIWIDYRFFPATFIIYEAMWMAGYFIIAVMVWKLLQIAVYIGDIFDKFETDIKPFHPDKCGGLRPITQIVVNINMIVFAAGLSLVIIYYSYLRDLISNIWVLFVGYIVISIFLFFFPLLGARESMKVNKEQFLELFSEPLNREYELIFQEFRDGIDDYDKHLDEKHLAKVQNIRDLYDRAMKMPIWPFDRDTILTFASRVLLPVLLVVINIIIAQYFPFLGAP